MFKVFLADDDIFCQTMYLHHLKKLGFRDVSYFSDGDTLLNRLNDQPDLIFLDFHLGNYDGIELLKSIKKSCPQTTVIIISGQDDMQKTVQLMNMGAFDYIIKDEHVINSIAVTVGKWFASRSFQEKTIPSSSSIQKVVAEAQEEVRKEISSELHDNINQLLGVTRLYLESACADENNRLTLMNKSKEMVTIAINEIRKISHSLQSLYVKETDLEFELINVIDMLKQLKKFNVKTQIATEGLNQSFPDTVRHHLVRIFQEMINNIIRYSNAKNIQIKVQQEGKEWHISVEDDGVGFDMNNYQKGLGLTNIFYRVSEIQSTCCIKTAPLKGCFWKLVVPVHIKKNQSIKVAK